MSDKMLEQRLAYIAVELLSGDVEIAENSGVFIQSMDALEEFGAQDGIDYSEYPYWVTTNDGVKPEPMKSMRCALDYARDFLIERG